MRALKHLIPQDVSGSLNANPTFQWFVVVLMVVVGAFLVVKGVNGVKDRRLTGKRGRVFEGTTAQVLGLLYVVFGSLFALVAIAMKLSG